MGCRSISFSESSVLTSVKLTGMRSVFLLCTSLDRISSSCCDGIISYGTFGSQLILLMCVRINQDAFMCSYVMPMMSHVDYFTPPILLGLFVCKDFRKKDFHGGSFTLGVKRSEKTVSNTSVISDKQK